MYRETAKNLLHFIQKSPTAFHAVQAMKSALLYMGFTELREEELWNIQKGGSYVVTRNDSALIAFTIPEWRTESFRIIASHSDSPLFKIKEDPEICVEQQYVKLNVEKYGGMLCAPWFDRPLSAAGRVVIKENGAFVSKLVQLEKDMLLIPSLAIHMNRSANDGQAYDMKKNVIPLYGGQEAKGTFMKQIAEAAGVKEEEILGHDLYVYNRAPGSLWGAQEEFISAPRLDDLQCVFASFRAFIQGKKENHIAVHCVLDNEEVGSTTKQGAASTFLSDTLKRLYYALGYGWEDYAAALHRSFMISADNAHAVHPNYPEMSDVNNRVYLNGGPVVKFNGNQKYCTDGISAAMFRDICRQANVPVQVYTNRSDLAGGSTLGNIANTKTALHTADIGLPQLAMHSPYETAGVKDTQYLIDAAALFFA